MPVAAATPPRSRAAPSLAGIGRVYLWVGGSLWIGRAAGLSSLHAHHAFQITLPLAAPIAFRTSAPSEWQDYAGAIVAPHRPHQFDGRGGQVAHLFVEPETPLGRVLSDLTGGQAIAPLARAQAQPLIDPLYRQFDTDPAEAPMIEAAQRALHALARDAPPPAAVDARIARLQAWLRTQTGAAPTLAQAAAQVHLSPGRLRHLFVAQTGSSYRVYLLWLRLLAAVQAFERGAAWTEAAHAAGFADSAHLSRSFRRMFGFSPVQMVKDSERDPAHDEDKRGTLPHQGERKRAGLPPSFAA
jgi:AraC family transcriptional regulator